MIKNLLFILLIFQTTISIGQNIEITVLNKESQPMPYAFILINGKPTTVSDTLGTSLIPENKLKEKDTISVSYLGAKASYVIYNQPLRERKKHIFYLDESVFNLNEVLVTYQDNEKLLKKSIKDIPPLNYDCQLNAKFDADLTYTGNSKYLVSGIFEAANGLRHTSEYLNWSAPPLKIVPEGDTAVIGRFLDPEIRLVFFNIYQSLSILRYKGNRIKKPYYNYLGEKDNLKVFRISFPPGYISNFYVQIVLQVDKKSKNIQSIEMDSFESNPSINSLKYNLKFDCDVFTNSNPKLNKIYLPSNIEFKYQIVDKLQFELKIFDISIK